MGSRRACDEEGPLLEALFEASPPALTPVPAFTPLYTPPFTPRLAPVPVFAPEELEPVLLPELLGADELLELLPEPVLEEDDVFPPIPAAVAPPVPADPAPPPAAAPAPVPSASPFKDNDARITMYAIG